MRSVPVAKEYICPWFPRAVPSGGRREVTGRHASRLLVFREAHSERGRTWSGGGVLIWTRSQSGDRPKAEVRQIANRKAHKSRKKTKSRQKEGSGPIPARAIGYFRSEKGIGGGKKPALAHGRRPAAEGRNRLGSDEQRARLSKGPLLGKNVKGIS